MVDYTCKNSYNFDDLVEIMSILRSENGCPWDKEQDHKSIRKNFIEEVYEAVEAIDEQDPEHLCEELGDVLLQVVFHAQIEKDAGGFGISEVADGICKKLILRHPHIFGSVKADNSAQVLENWDKIKKKEKGYDTSAKTVGGVAKSLPALMRAEKIQSRAVKEGFAFYDTEQLCADAAEHTALIGSMCGTDAGGDRCGAAAARDGNAKKELLGRLLFECVQLGRAVGVDPEEALAEYCGHFCDKFAEAESRLREKGESFASLTACQADAMING